MISILVICGPTATGKTKLGFELARKFNGELISADSRQVYKEMDIGTGKDLPKKFKVQSSKFKVNKRHVSCFTDGKTRVWGLDLVRPDQEFSISDYQSFVIPVIEDIHKRGKLPIVVGGTGLYIKTLIEPIETIHIKPSVVLRSKLAQLSVGSLKQRLKRVNSARFDQMNQSDQNNPRRLVRAIEVALSKKQTHPKFSNYYKSLDSPLIICLKAPISFLQKKIQIRIKKRLKQGLLLEIQSLLARGYTRDLPAMSGLGYKEWEPLFKNSELRIQNSKLNQKLKEKIIQKWESNELNYAKRQLTWFKKQKNLNWFDVSKNKWKKQVVELVNQWYTEMNQELRFMN